jgi:hypothetical protein
MAYLLPLLGLLNPIISVSTAIQLMDSKWHSLRNRSNFEQKEAQSLGTSIPIRR